MTITTTKSRINQLADGVQTVFVYDFIVLDSTHMNVYFDAVLQVAGFTVNGVGNQAGGDVTFDAAPANNVTVTLDRIVPLNQLVDYLPYDNFPAETHEGALDKLTLITQQNSDAIDRAAKAPINDDGTTDYTLPSYVAGKGIMFSESDPKTIVTSEDDLNGITGAAQASADAAAASASAASSSAASASDDAAATAVDRVATGEDVGYAEEWATKPEDVPVSAAAGGSPTEFSSLHWAKKSAASGAPDADQFSNINTRNGLITPNPLSQAVAQAVGISSKIYTGNGATQSIVTDVDMASGNLGGFVWIKGRSSVVSHILQDTVRGVNSQLFSDLTNAEQTSATRITSFNANGFSLGADASVNTNGDTYIAWNFQTNQKVVGTTNRGKTYTAHYNANLGFSAIGYEGDGLDGHEIPHFLGRVPELSIFKSRDAVNGWAVKSPLLGADGFLEMQSTAALNTGTTNTTSAFDDNTVSIDTWSAYNANTNNFISYHFTSIAGVSKVGKYIGTGATGNYVDCGFKPAFILLKSLDATQNWMLIDTIRGTGTSLAKLYANTTEAEATVGGLVDVDGNGFYSLGGDTLNNTLNDEYIFLAFAESSIDATKAITNYPNPINADQLSVANPTAMTFAKGFDANGQVDRQEQILGDTLTFGAGFELKKLYIYRDKGVAWGFNEVRPIVGLERNDADKFGVESPSDASLRATAKHYDYKSETGVVSANENNDPSWRAFNNVDAPYGSNVWTTLTGTNSWVQYRFSEARILKSWRMRTPNTAGRLPRLFTIEGSNDGLNWTAIDSTYTASDYVGNGADLWGDLQSTIANTVAYTHHRINITANTDGTAVTQIAELEFNTKIAADYYLEPQGRMFDDAGTALERVYVGEVITDASGNVSNFTNYANAKKNINEIEVQGKAVFHGETLGLMFATAWVNFDGTQEPPLIRSSFNVKDVVRISVGVYKIVFETPMNNEGYIIVDSVKRFADSVNSGASIESARLDKMSAIATTADVSGSAINCAEVNLVFFGGKNIKAIN